MAAGDDLDAAAAVALELGEERVLLGRRELVARRMGDDRDAAGVADPGHGVLQRRPAMRHEAGPAFDEKAAEDLLRVGADAALDQVAREVGARDQVGVADVAQRAFVGAGDADLRELVGHLAGTRLAAAARRREALRAARSSSLSMPRPTMCTVVSRKVTEISTPWR